MNEQGTESWFADRCGCATASRIADIIATTKSGPSASRQNYLAQLVAERLTGTVDPSFSNAAMVWGTETEPLARAEYEILTGEMVEQVGFVRHPQIPTAGASPDGLVCDDGLVEIKCPNTATHIEYLLAGKVVSKYVPQMAWQIICTGRKWCDFVSYDPRLPDGLKLFKIRYTPEPEYLKDLEDKVCEFLKDVEQTVLKLKALKG